METIQNLPVEEHRSTTRYNDISTVYAHLVEPIAHEHYIQKTDSFSCFSGHYEVRKEREFIADLIEKNPGKYNKFVIGWSDCN